LSEALEKDLYLDVNAKDRKKIIDVFKLAKAIQLPVVNDKKVVGIIDLFVLLDNRGKYINLDKLIEKDIIIAGENKNVFSFKNSKQQILPFVDKDGDYLGFVNKLFQKCYLPSKEYMQVIEANLDKIKDDDTDVNYEQLKNSFDAIFESNYDGIYITVDKGTTLSINNQCKFAHDLTADDISIDENRINLSFEDHNITNVTIAQNIQKKQK